MSSPAKSLLGRVRGNAAVAEPAAEPLIEGAPLAGVPVFVRHHQAWAFCEAQQRFIAALVGLCFVLVAVMGVGVWIASHRPRYRLEGMPHPTDATANRAAVLDLRSAHFGIFLQATLPTLNTTSEQGSPLIQALSGMVSADIISEHQAVLMRRQADVQKLGITQTLLIDELRDPVQNKSETDQQVSYYVVGRIKIVAEKSPAGVVPKTVDYRARALVSIREPSAANPFPFFLLKLEERLGEEARQWDYAQSTYNLPVAEEK